MASKKRNTDLNEAEVAVIATIKALTSNFQTAVDRIGTINGTLQNIVQSLGGGTTGAGVLGGISDLNNSIRGIVSSLQQINIVTNPANPTNPINPNPANINNPTNPNPANPTNPINPNPVNPNPVNPNPIIPPPLPQQDEDRDATQAYFKLQGAIQLFSVFQSKLNNAAEAINKLIPSIDSLKIGLSLLSQVSQNISNLPQKLIDLNQNLLGMGTDLKNFKNEVGFMVEGLAGSTAQNLQNAATLYSLGFRGNNKSLLDLAARMDLTGQRTTALTNEFTKITTIMGLNNRQMNVLAEVVKQTSENYKVKSDELIEALGKVQNQNVMATAGFGSTFMKSLTPLLGEFTRNRTEILNLINALTKTETLIKLAPIDPQIISLARRLERAGSSEELKGILIQITGKLSSFAQMLAGQAGAAGQSSQLPTTAILSDLLSILGMSVADSTQLYNSLTGQLDDHTISLNRSVEIQNSFSAAIQKLANVAYPLITAIINVSVSIINFIGSLGKVPILLGIFILLNKVILDSIVSTATQTLSVIQSINSIRSFNFSTAMASGGLKSFAIGATIAASVLTLGLTSLFAVATAAFSTYSLFNEGADKNADAINQNTAALNQVNSQQERNRFNQNTFLDAMNQNIQFALSKNDRVIEIMQEVARGSADQKQALDRLIQIGTTQANGIIDLASSKSRP